MTMGLFALVAVPLMIAAYIVGHGKNKGAGAALAIASGGFWALTAFQSYTLSDYPTTSVWDVYYGAVYICLALLIVSILEPFLMRDRKEQSLADDEAVIPDGERMEQEWDDLAAQTRIPRVGSRAYASRQSARARRRSQARKGPQY